jgi:hydroxymethylpyrimidine/phosphomethylpyrimidine kinase
MPSSDPCEEIAMKQLLTIAGSDSSGGAGIQADLKTFSALGCYGMSAICAVTAQNTEGVAASRILDPEIVVDQLDAIFDDIRVDAVKIGMLGDASTIGCVAGVLRERRPPIVVLDPVMVSKSGHRLLEPEAASALISLLFPLATLVTPNIPEAEAIAGGRIENIAQMEAAARKLMELGAKAVLLKGGHLAGEAVDLLVDAGGKREYPGPRVDARHTHGTGCSLSSAIAALIARGSSLHDAAGEAKAWVAQGIREGLDIGAGCGPIHHFHEFYDAGGKRR